jgi:adenylate cyclase
MAKETERKFLVSNGAWRKRADRGKAIRQAYLALTDTMSLRVRTVGKRQAFLTIKGTRSGATRSEFEYPIPPKDARALMKLRTGRLIRTRRHTVKAGRTRVTVDVFGGKHRGLILAEVELPSGRRRFDHPEWLGRDVTDDDRYYNANLAKP